MSVFIEKYLKISIINVFIEWKESMGKEVEEGRMPMSHGIENINKDIEIIKKN